MHLSSSSCTSDMGATLKLWLYLCNRTAFVKLQKNKTDVDE